MQDAARPTDRARVVRDGAASGRASRPMAGGREDLATAGPGGRSRGTCERRTGIEFSPYTLRHTSLTNLARAGWAPEHLQDRAGHAQFQTTYAFYVHPDR